MGPLRKRVCSFGSSHFFAMPPNFHSTTDIPTAAVYSTIATHYIQLLPSILHSNFIISGIWTGNLSIHSAQAPSLGLSTSLRHFHTALLHLNPLPSPSCHVLIPFFIHPFASTYPSSYHTELLDVFPNRYSVILDASTCSSVSLRFFCTSSITARPPA